MENCVALFCYFTFKVFNTNSHVLMSTKKLISKCCVLVPLSTMLGANLDLGFICFQEREQVGPSLFYFKSVTFIDNCLTNSILLWKQNIAQVQHY